MLKNLCKYFLFSPALLGGTIAIAAAIATTATASYAEEIPVTSEKGDSESKVRETPQRMISQLPTTTEASPTTSNSERSLEQIDRYTNENPQPESFIDQVTSVSQLRDVQPTDWAFQALQSLVERYGCIEGYPDRTYRGNRAMTRYEFAAGLNKCLDRIQELIAALPGGISKEDLGRLQRLQEEFAAELANLRGRVDNLEARVNTVEAQQFSTTTKLQGEALFVATSILAGENAFGQKLDRVPIAGYRTRLNFETSFTGKDLLRTRLEAGNLAAYSSVTFTPEGDLFFGGGPFETSDNTLVLDELSYTFQIGESTEVIISAHQTGTDSFVNTLNPFFDGDGTTGALSRFGTRHPIYYLADGTGITLRQQFGEAVELSLGYGAASDTANDPFPGRGFLNGPYGAIAQLSFKPSESLQFGFTYVNSYNVDLGAGSRVANLRSYLAAFEPFAGDNDLPISSNSYGFGFSWRLSPGFALGGWAGYTKTRTLSTLDGQINRGSIDIYNGAITLAFPDLLKKGSLGGIIVGIEPIADASTRLSNDLFNAGLGGDDDDVSFHIEGFYQLQITDNIAITPGVIWLTAPDHNSGNKDIFIGTIRTTFTF